MQTIETDTSKHLTPEGQYGLAGPGGYGSALSDCGMLKFANGLTGPFALDIEGSEEGVKLSFIKRYNGSASHQVLLPARPYHTLFRDFAQNQNPSAGLLEKGGEAITQTLKEQGVEVDKYTARHLFGAAAMVMGPMFARGAQPTPV